MPYWQLFYHIVWTTKNREQSIRPVARTSLHNAIAAKAAQLGARIHAVGGTADHVHVVVSVPPSVVLSEFIGKLKGSSAHFLNHQLELPRPFGWQSEYGVMSFDAKLLSKMIEYVRGQQQHHQDGTVIPVLERVSTRDPNAKTD